MEEQQNESCAQIALTQMSHVEERLAPVVQAEWAQVMRLQLSSQIESTSPVQVDSQVEEQQTESAAQIFVAHGSHDEVRAPPLKQIEWEQPAVVHSDPLERAIAEIARAMRRLVDSLETTAPPKNRELEAAKARERSAHRFG